MDSEKDQSGGGDFDDNVKVNHQEVSFLSNFFVDLYGWKNM